MYRKLLLACILLVVARVSSFLPICKNFRIYAATSSIRLKAKSKMPSFSEDDENELRRIIDGRDISQARPGAGSKTGSAHKKSEPLSSISSGNTLSELTKLAELKSAGFLSEEEFSVAKARILNIPVGSHSPSSSKATESVSASTLYRQRDDDIQDLQSATIQTSKKNIPPPNKDWRSVKITANPTLYTSSTPGASFENIRSMTYDESMNSVSGIGKSSASKKSSNYEHEIEFDYADFESAMFEEEGRGMFLSEGGPAGKISYDPIEHSGLVSGDIIDTSIWTNLLSVDGKPCEFDQVHKSTDVLAIYCDPRRMTSECRIIITEFRKIPLKELAISLAVVNCDDFNDHRKFLKKNTGLLFPLLADPSKCMMDSIKCRASKRLVSALLLLEVSTGKVIKVWYENDWDALTTKDLLVDEMKVYRKNPVSYAQSQIGLR